MSLSVRVIPCLDVDAGRVVKGVNFRELRDAGDPVEMARLYDAEGADELVFLDITASSGSRETTYDVVRRTAEQVFIPLTVGGGVRTVDDVDRLLRSGADKVGVNTAAIARPELIAETADRFGSQVLVLSADVRRRRRDDGTVTDDVEVTTEANPDSVTPQSLRELADGGFTRVSLGMQSAVPHVLATLDRTHDPAGVGRAVQAARDAGLPGAVAKEATRTAVRSYREILRALASRSVVDRFWFQVEADWLVERAKGDGRKLLQSQAARARRRTSEQVLGRMGVVDADGRTRIREDPPLTRRVPQVSHDDMAEHFARYRRTTRQDVQLLLRQLNRLVDAGNTVVVVEHAMDVVASSDWVIDMGPSGGEAGGRIVCAGTPAEVAACPASRTAPYLAAALA